MTTYATASSGAYPETARQTDSYVIAVMNQKGGVGKTMVTLALAAHTAAANGRALVVDVDPQATAYDLTQLIEDPGYDVVHELDPVELTRIRQLRDYDTILVDCPGSLEGRDVLDQVLARSTYVVIPYPHEPEAALPTLRRYVQSPTRLSAYNRGRDPAWDGIAIIWFDDSAALRAATTTPEWDRAKADDGNFIAPGPVWFIITTEHVIVA